MKKNIFFLLCIILLNLRVNLIGSISITELFVLTQIPKLWRWSNLLNFGLIRKIRKLFLYLIVSQFISELIIRNDIINLVKGIMITVMALFILLFILYEIIERKVSILMVPIGLIIAQIALGDQFGFADSGDSSVWFKFYVVPIVSNGICCLFLLNKKWINHNVVLLFLITAIFMMAFGSRTGGFTMLLSLILYFIFNRKVNLTKWQILKVLIPALIILQLFYAFIYVPKIKSGDWGSEQNRAQMAAIDYSSNCLMLIMAARSDFYVSTVAFMDEPLLGHGSWARDKDLKYAKISARLAELDEMRVFEIADRYGYPLIPMHSILVGMGARNGILSFVLFLYIFILIYKGSFKLLKVKPKHLPYICYLIVVSFQAVLFSPMAILKNFVVVMWAVLLAYYYINNKKYKNESTSCYCNL